MLLSDLHAWEYAISGSTLLEVWGYRKHHKALTELTQQSKASKA